MNTRVAFACLVGALVAMSCRPALPSPRYPLVTTPDEPLRASPPPPMEVTLPPSIVPVMTTLANGTHVVVVRRPGARTFIIDVVNSAAGSADTRWPPGLARLTASVVNDTLSTPTISAVPTTDWDHTTFELSSLSEDWEETLGRIALIFDEHALTAERFDRRLDEMVDARVQQRERLSVATEVVLGRLFGTSHPYGRPTGGRFTALRALTINDLRRFWHERYVPEACTLIITGDRDPALVLQQLSGFFGAIPSHPPPPPLEVDMTPPPRGPRLAIIQSDNRQQFDVAIALRAPAIRAEDAAAVRVLVDLLGTGLGSRLNANVREDLNASYAVQATAILGRGGGALLFAATVERDALGRSVTAMLTEIARLAGEPIRPEELAQERTRWHERAVAHADSTAALSAWLGAALERDLDAERTQVDALSPDALLTVAQRYFDANHAQIAITGDTSEIESQLRPLHLGPTLRLRP